MRHKVKGMGGLTLWLEKMDSIYLEPCQTEILIQGNGSRGSKSTAIRIIAPNEVAITSNRYLRRDLEKCKAALKKIESSAYVNYQEYQEIARETLKGLGE